MNLDENITKIYMNEYDKSLMTILVTKVFFDMLSKKLSKSIILR